MKFRGLSTDWGRLAAQNLLQWRLSRVDLRDVVRAVTGVSRLTTDAGRVLFLQDAVFRRMAVRYQGLEEERGEVLQH